jgi:hypothetical protein
MSLVSIFLLDNSTPRAKNTANSGEVLPGSAKAGRSPVTGIYELIQFASALQ